VVSPSTEGVSPAPAVPTVAGGGPAVVSPSTEGVSPAPAVPTVARGRSSGGVAEHGGCVASTGGTTGPTVAEGGNKVWSRL